MFDLATTALLLIDNHSTFLDNPSHWGKKRSNPSYEANLTALLAGFRAAGTNSPGTTSTKPTIIHIAHHSTNPLSPLHPSGDNSFAAFTTPLPGEGVIIKSANSAFIGTELEAVLRGLGITSLLTCGLVTDHCVSTTTRMAKDLQVASRVVLVADATATFNRGDIDAEVVHAVNVESLRGEFAEIMTVAEVLRELRGEEVM